MDTISSDELDKTQEESLPQRTYLEVDSSFGEVRELTRGYANVWLSTSKTMSIDNMGLVHPGFIFSSANFAAMCAINDPNAILIGADAKFLAPTEAGNEIEFRAHALQHDTKKREVRVEGYVLDIKVFDATFFVAMFDHHIFKLRITEKKR
ncbi:MAG: PaaI family thioesterase [Wolinella sp.]